MADDVVTKAADAIRARAPGDFPKTALVLGSGLGRFGEAIDVAASLPYGEIPGFPVSTVKGHEGRLIIGAAGPASVVCMQGRMHVYEGYEAQRLAEAVLGRVGVVVEKYVHHQCDRRRGIARQNGDGGIRVPHAI